jgi:hypothetical protein
MYWQKFGWAKLVSDFTPPHLVTLAASRARLHWQFSSGRTNFRVGKKKETQFSESRNSPADPVLSKP